MLSAFKYINYASTSWQGDSMKGYGTNEVRRLRKVGREYDPMGVFWKQVEGGFKVPK